MVDVDKKTVEHIANISRLLVSKNDLDVFSKDLTNIVNHFHELEEIDTSNIKPLTNVMNEHLDFYVNGNQLRQDNIRPSLSVEEIIKNAPDSQLNQFKLEAVIESE